MEEDTPVSTIQFSWSSSDQSLSDKAKSGPIDMSLDDIISSKPKRSARGRGAGPVKNFRDNRSSQRNSPYSRGGFRGSYNNRSFSTNGSRGGNRGRGGRGGRGGNRGGNRQTNYRPQRGNSDNQWSHDMFDESITGPEDDFGDDFQLEMDTNRQPRKRGTGQTETGVALSISGLNFNVTPDDLEELFEVVGSVTSATVHYDKSGRSVGTGRVIMANSRAAQAAVQRYNGETLDDQVMRISIENSPDSTAGLSNRLSSRIGTRRNQSPW